MSDDLVKRLDHFDADDLHREAADRIEALGAENMALRDKLAKAVEALVRIADKPSEMTWGVDSEVRETMNGMEIISETTLAELTGQDDE